MNSKLFQTRFTYFGLICRMALR